MAGDRARVTVGDYVTLIRGTTYKGELVGKPGPALLGLGSIVPGGGFRIGDYKTYGGECPDELMLFPGDIYASLKGATKDGEMIGSVARVPPSIASGRLTQDTVKLVFRQPNPDEMRYLYWVLRTPQYRAYCAGYAMGSAVVALSRRDFLSYPVPPLTPQRKALAELLDALDDKIDLNRRMSETLEAIAQAIFKSWFVDFDPARAKFEGRPACLSPRVGQLFPDHFVDSRMGQIPAGWKSSTWGGLISLEYGKALRSYRPGAFPVYGTNGPIGFHDEPSCDHPTVVVGRKGAYRGIHFSSTPPFVIDTAFFVEPRSGCEILWAYYEMARVKLDNMDSGSAIPSTSREQFYALPVVIPPIDVQRAFVHLVEPILRKKDCLSAEAATLAALRKTLLPKLLSREISVSRCLGGAT